MRPIFCLIICANVVNGAALVLGAQHRLEKAKRSHGLQLWQAQNATNQTRNGTGIEQAYRDAASNTTNFLHARRSEHNAPGQVTFRSFYDSHTTGRGVWKWANALDAYDRHFQAWKGQKLKVGEVGVQSGGSILMWQGVLGSQIQMYGLDINPACLNFKGPGVEITIGDQSDPAMWKGFFSKVTPSLDILIDDGGHEPHQMLTTMYQVFPHISKGGFFVIEDIHGQHYMQSFFAPAAHFIGQSAQSNLVEAVHLYPFLMVVEKKGPNPDLPKSQLQFSATGTAVDSFEALWAAIPQFPGGTIVLSNPGWGPFLTGAGLTNFFAVFIHLHNSAFVDNPPGCRTTAAVVCTNAIHNSAAQSAVSGVHIYNDRLIVEVPASPPVIQAVRKGDEFIGYGL